MNWLFTGVCVVLALIITIKAIRDMDLSVTDDAVPRIVIVAGILFLYGTLEPVEPLMTGLGIFLGAWVFHPLIREIFRT